MKLNYLICAAGFVFLILVNVGAAKSIDKNILISWKNYGGYTVPASNPKDPEMILYNDGTFVFVDADETSHAYVQKQVKIRPNDLAALKEFLSDFLSMVEHEKYRKPQATDLPITRIVIYLNNRHTVLERYGLIAYLMPELRQSLNLPVDNEPKALTGLFMKLNKLKEYK